VFYHGLDLGQSGDPSALAALEQTRRADGLHVYAVRGLERWLGVPYVAAPGQPSLVETTRQRIALTPGCQLVADRTGVGRAEVDAFRAAGFPCAVWGVTITAGHEARQEGLDCWVPKKDLVGVVRTLLESGRLTITASLKLARTLADELRNFRVKITAAANETFGEWRTGQHDDLVLSVALAAWLGERFPAWGPGDISSGDSGFRAELEAALGPTPDLDNVEW
jgi:hypothetical protein